MKKYILTEEQVKRVIDGMVNEQSAVDRIYKAPDIKVKTGMNTKTNEVPSLVSTRWWVPIKNIAKDKMGLTNDNTGVWFITPGGDYEVDFDADNTFEIYDNNTKVKTAEGKWVPNKEGGVTVTTKDGRILTYTPQGGMSPVTITNKGGNSQSITPTVKTLNDILSGKGYLAKGMKGPVVGELQKVMLQLNLKISKTGKVDNVFGPIMDLSVKQFQGNNMSKGQMDGKVGKRTLKRMIEIRDYDGSTQKPVSGDTVDFSQNPDFVQAQSATGGTQPVPTPAKTSDTTATQPKQKLVLTPKQ